MAHEQLLQDVSRMSLPDRLAFLEAALHAVREEIQCLPSATVASANLDEQRRRMTEAAQRMLPDYRPGGALAGLWETGDEEYSETG